MSELESIQGARKGEQIRVGERPTESGVGDRLPSQWRGEAVAEAAQKSHSEVGHMETAFQGTLNTDQMTGLVSFFFER